MPVDININGKIYKVGCSKEDENRVTTLGDALNDKINKLKASDPKFFIGLNNETLLLFTALTMLEEMDDIQKNQVQLAQNFNQQNHQEIEVMLEKVRLAIKSTTNANTSIKSINQQLNQINK